VPARDRRSVGELLADTDLVARETLLDASADQALAMVRTWSRVVVSANQLWAVLPPASFAPPSEPDVMVRLHEVGIGIGRSVSAGPWPGSGPMDERLTQMAQNLSRAAFLVKRYGRDVQPLTDKSRADIAAARSRVMHALYVGAHGTTVTLTEHVKDMQHRLQIDARRRRPMSERPTTGEIKAAQVMINRLGVFEQLATGYVAAHPVTLASFGEVAATPRAIRLQSALAGWDIQVHRTLAANPNSLDLVRIARVQALLATVGGIVTEAAATMGKLDRGLAEQLAPRLADAQLAWTRAAKRWAELNGPASRTDPALARAAGEVRAALAATASTPTGWAAPDQLAEPLDLARTAKTLHLSLLAAVDVAYLTREIAANHPGLTAPARVIAMRAQGEAELAADQGETQYDGTVWATPHQVATNQPIPLPEPARRGLVNLAEDVIASSNRAVAAAAPLSSRDPAQRDNTAIRGGSAKTREIPANSPTLEGPRR
jgi:hypothetical protein